MGRRARFGYRSLVVALGMALAATGPVAGSPAAGAAPPTIRGHVRVDQVGYATGEAKRAFLLAEAPAGGARFAVVDAGGRTVLSGRVGPRTGGWNGRYRAVHRIDFSGLRRPGRYRIVVDGLAAPRRRSGWRADGPCSAGWSPTPSASSRSSATAPTSRGSWTARPPT